MDHESKSNHLPWENHPFRTLLRLSWPLIASVLSFSIMNAVDTLFVARLGAEPLAGMALGSTSSFLLLCFSIGFLRAAKVLVAQAVGALRRETVDLYLAAALSAAAVGGVLTLVAAFAFAWTVPWFTKSLVTSEAAQAYVTILGIGALPRLLSVAIRQVRYGLGDTRSPMVATLVANLSNVGLNAWFICVLEWGVAGAAWGTSIANGIELVVMVFVQLRAGPSPRWARPAFRELVRLGVPSGIQFVAEFGAFATITLVLSSIGALELAAHQIAMHVIHLSFLPAFAVSEAASVLVGQAVGAGRLELVRGLALRALALASGHTALCSLILLCGGEPIARCFSGDHALVQRTGELLLVASVFQIADGALVVAREALRGTGDVRFPAVVGVGAAWGLALPVTWWLGALVGWGAVGGWIGLCLEIFVSAGLLWHRLLAGAWCSAARLRHRLALCEAG
jgi:MATE family multidrug resistance protein